MSANKEAVISEKDLSCRFGQEVLVGYAEAIHSSAYDSFDAFVDAVQREWDIQWKRIYTAEFSSVYICLKSTCIISEHSCIWSYTVQVHTALHIVAALAVLSSWRGQLMQLLVVEALSAKGISVLCSG